MPQKMMKVRTIEGREYTITEDMYDDFNRFNPDRKLELLSTEIVPDEDYSEEEMD